MGRNWLEPQGQFAGPGVVDDDPVAGLEAGTVTATTGLWMVGQIFGHFFSQFANPSFLLAEFAVLMRRHAASHPDAQLTAPISVADVLASKPIASPAVAGAFGATPRTTVHDASRGTSPRAPWAHGLVCLNAAKCGYTPPAASPCSPARTATARAMRPRLRRW